MAEFNIFGSSSKDDLRVGYISTSRGYVDGVSVCEANDYAKKNPGTRFIFKTRDKIEYLGINDVNKLTPDKALPSTASSCPGVRLETECGPVKVNFYGGGGVGAKANPIIGKDGSLLAIDLVAGGFGYQYPPVTEVRDNCGIGAGTVARSVLGEIVETVEYFEQEEDFETYDICPPDSVGYGRLYSPDGKDIGEWDPTAYTNLSQDPIRREIKAYQEFLASLRGGFRFNADDKTIHDWWTTRLKAPLKVTSANRTTRIKHDVTDATFLEKQRKDGVKDPVGWSEFLNKHAISPVPPSNAPGSDFAGQVFTFEWEEEFPYAGEYVFRAQVDNLGRFYLDNQKLLETSEFRQNQTPKLAKRTVTAGVHRIRIDLYNEPLYETVIIPPKTEEQRAGSLFIKEGGNYYILIGGNDVVQIDFVFDWNDDTSFGYAVTKITLPTERGPLVFSRPLSGTTGTSGVLTGTFKANQKYGPIIFEGTAPGSRVPEIKDSGPNPDQRQAKIIFWDANANDTIPNAQLAAVNAKQLSPPRIIQQPQTGTVKTRKVFNTIDYIDKANRKLWKTNVYNRGGFLNQYGVCPFDTNLKLEDNPYAGTHEIVWDNIDFSIDGNYIIEVEVDDNVNLIFEGPQERVVITKKGFSTGDRSTGKSIETKFFKKGKYKITAELEQIPGGKFRFDDSIKGINPMALAVNIEVAFTEKKVISAKSWNENPMGVALTIDAPLPPIPQEPIPLQEGRCPRNPMWTTRFPGGSEKWYPVNFSSPKTVTETIATTTTPTTSNTQEVEFSIYGEGNRTKNLSFVFTAANGEHTFILKGVDKNKDSRTEKINIRKNVNYVVSAKEESNQVIVQGLINNNNKEKEQDTGESKKIFADYNFTGSGATEEWSRVANEYGAPVRSTGRLGSLGPVTGGTFHRYDLGTWFRSRRIRQGGDWNDTNPYTNYIENPFNPSQRLTLGTYRGNDFAIAVWERKTTNLNVDINDIQITASSGSFKSSNKRKPSADKGSTYDLTFKLEAAPGAKPETTTRTTTYQVPGWSKFMNRYAISPVPPLAKNGTDGAGVVYRSSWNLDIPYNGFYAVKGTVDNFGKIIIDGKVVLGSRYKSPYTFRQGPNDPDSKTLGIPAVTRAFTDGLTSADIRVEAAKQGFKINPNAQPLLAQGSQNQSTSSSSSGKEIKLDGFNVENPKSTKIFLTKGMHSIQVEVENKKVETFVQIDKKIFNTSDWIVTPQLEEQRAGSLFIKEGGNYYILIGGNDVVQIDFVFDWNDDTSFGYAITKITLPTETNGPLVFSRPLSGTTGTSGVLTGTFKANQKYGPIIFEGTAPASRLPEIKDSGPNPDQRQAKIIFWDANASDTIPNAQLVAVNARQLSPARVVRQPSQSPAKNGVTYSGPVLATYRDGPLGPSLTPAFNGDDDYRANNMGRSWKSVWSNVDFPETGQYDLKAEADDEVIVRVDGVEVGRAKVFEGIRTFTFNATKGKKTLELEFRNIPGNNTSTFATNPVVFTVIITKKINISTGIGKPWTVNPIGISAILIPPPCPRVIKGKGVVTRVDVDDPGNSFPPPTGPGYPVALRLKSVNVLDPGINHNCGVDKIEITPSNGAVLDYDCDSFGRIRSVKVLNPGLGFVAYPDIRMVTDTGINATFAPQFEVVRDPIVVDPQKLIQVTDLAGLKQTGYVDGRAYYGAVFLKDGLLFAGFYETPGELVQVYATLKESIDAQVTTRPSAIQRQGTDITSNDPRLNIPGTPDQII